LRNRKGSAGVLLTSVATTKHWRAARRVRPGERSGLQGLGAVRLSVKQTLRAKAATIHGHGRWSCDEGKHTQASTRKRPRPQQVRPASCRQQHIDPAGRCQDMCSLGRQNSAKQASCRGTG